MHIYTLVIFRHEPYEYSEFSLSLVTSFAFGYGCLFQRIYSKEDAF